jgi:peroxiredoxin
LRDQYETIRLLGGTVYGISSSSIEEIKHSAHAQTLPFALMADPELRMIGSLGLARFDEGEQRHVSRPAMYVADTNRVIKFAHVGDHSRDRPAIGSILLALERLRDEST